MEEKETMGIRWMESLLYNNKGEDVNLIGEGFSIAREFFDRYL